MIERRTAGIHVLVLQWVQDTLAFIKSFPDIPLLPLLYRPRYRRRLSSQSCACVAVTVRL